MVLEQTSYGLTLDSLPAGRQAASAKGGQAWPG